MRAATQLFDDHQKRFFEQGEQLLAVGLQRDRAVTEALDLQQDLAHASTTIQANAQVLFKQSQELLRLNHEHNDARSEVQQLKKKLADTVQANAQAAQQHGEKLALMSTATSKLEDEKQQLGEEKKSLAEQLNATGKSLTEATAQGQAKAQALSVEVEALKDRVAELQKSNAEATQEAINSEAEADQFHQ